MKTPKLLLSSRPRRNRQNSTIRSFHRETHLSADHFIYPLFLHAGKGKQTIDSMPGCFRHGADSLLQEVEDALKDGIGAFTLFPAVDDRLKTKGCEEAYNDKGLIPETLLILKKKWPEIFVVTDIALDPYSADGHDGLVSADGKILNDETVEVLCRQALCHAAAGADMVAPSDMMDGRVGAIRRALDTDSFENVTILSYCAKYASALYSPFREALASAPKAGNKKTYQMDPSNIREAIRELELDEEEGADMVMVKPASFYLDVIRAFREHSVLPVAAYQVSGEYAMIKAAAEKNWIDERRVALESLLAIRRAGADVILTYFARDAARWLKEADVPWK